MGFIKYELTLTVSIYIYLFIIFIYNFYMGCHLFGFTSHLFFALLFFTYSFFFISLMYVRMYVCVYFTHTSHTHAHYVLSLFFSSPFEFSLNRIFLFLLKSYSVSTIIFFVLFADYYILFVSLHNVWMCLNFVCILYVCGCGCGCTCNLIRFSFLFFLQYLF